MITTLLRLMLVCLMPEVDAVVNHLGVTPGLIRVHAFALPQHGIEIRATPDYLQEFLDRPEDFPEEKGAI